MGFIHYRLTKVIIKKEINIHSVLWNSCLPNHTRCKHDTCLYEVMKYTYIDDITDYAACRVKRGDERCPNRNYLGYN